jgi:CheY-like chemotaxis protein
VRLYHLPDDLNDHVREVAFGGKSSFLEQDVSEQSRVNVPLTLLSDDGSTGPVVVLPGTRFPNNLSVAGDVSVRSVQGISMSRQPLVLLVPEDRVAGMTTASSLASYGFEILLASTMEEAEHLLRTNRRISALVIDTDLGQAGVSLSLAKDARVSDPELKVIYTSRMPFRLRDAEKVSGAPCLRTPYRPHQLAGVITQLIRRQATEEAEAYAA